MLVSERCLYLSGCMNLVSTFKSVYLAEYGFLQNFGANLLFVMLVTQFTCERSFKFNLKPWSLNFFKSSKACHVEVERVI
jgi:hypothetical protein